MNNDNNASGKIYEKPAVRTLDAGSIIEDLGPAMAGYNGFPDGVVRKL